MFGRIGFGFAITCDVGSDGWIDVMDGYLWETTTRVGNILLEEKINGG